MIKIQIAHLAILCPVARHYLSLQLRECSSGANAKLLLYYKEVALMEPEI
jgi:hypothetical protein